MRATGYLQNSLSKSLGEIHAGRLLAVQFAVECLLRGGRLTLTGLGRAGNGNAERHDVKRVDRLLGNHHLWRELPLFFRALGRAVLKGNTRPVIAVDWSEWREGFHTLTASVATCGKCLVIYGEVHPEAKLNNAQVHREFLDGLAAMFPKGTIPIIVTDGGFRNDWFKAVENHGWDYIGRVRGHVGYYDEDGTVWRSIQNLHGKATTKPANVGSLTLAKSNPLVVRLVSVFKKTTRRKKAREYRRKSRMEKRGESRHGVSASSTKYRKAAAEPWILATSMSCSPKAVVAIYAMRMQTEETYRGYKSHRFGWSFEDALSTQSNRLAVLLLVAALAAVVVSTLGCAAEQLALHRPFQVNTLKRRVLSWFYLGIRLIKRPLAPELRSLKLHRVLQQMSQNATLVIAENG